MKIFFDGLFVYIDYITANNTYLEICESSGIDIGVLDKRLQIMIKEKENIDLHLVIELAILEDFSRGAAARGNNYNFPSHENKRELNDELEKFVHFSNDSLFNLISSEDVSHGKSFDNYSTILGGADLDLISDSSIIDMKTNKDLNYQGKDWNQVIGYALLNKLHEPTTKVDKVFIYYARFDKMFYIDLNEINLYNHISEFDKVLKSL